MRGQSQRFAEYMVLVSSLTAFKSVTQYNTIQYNTLLTTAHGRFSVTMQLGEVTIAIVSKKAKIDSKTLHYVYIITIK